MLHHIWQWLSGLGAWLNEWLPYILSAIVNLLLVAAGILLSFQKLIDRIEENPKLRWGCTVVFVTLGLVGFWFDVTERHQNDKASHDLIENVQKELGETAKLLKEIRDVKTDVSLIPAVNTKIDILQARISVAKETHNPAVISNLQKQLEDEEKVKSLLSRQLLTHAGRSIGELRDIVHYWNSQREHAKDENERQRVDEEGRNTSLNTIANARAVTGQLLSLLPEISPEQRVEDQVEDAVFYSLLRNGSNPEGIQRVADYMDALVKRVLAANPQLAK